MNEFSFESTLARSYTVSHEDFLNGEVDEASTPERICFYAIASERNINGRVFECFKSNSIQSPLLDCLFACLSSKSVRERSLSSKNRLSRDLKTLFLAIENDIDRINDRGFIKSLFILLKKNGVAVGSFNSIVGLLNKALKSHELYGVEYSIEIKNALKELPRTVAEEAKPRDTLGQKLLGRHNSNQAEKQLWSGFNGFLREAWEISNELDSLIQSEYRHDMDLYNQIIEAYMGKNSFNSYPSELQRKLLITLSRCYIDRNERLLALHSSPEKLVYVEDNETPLRFYSYWFSKGKKCFKGHAKVLGKGSVTIPLSTGLLLPRHDAAFTDLELIVCRLILAKYQFSESMLSRLTPSCISVNLSSGKGGSVQIEENKNRGGSNPNTKRGHVYIFTRTKNKFEFDVFSQFYNKLSKYYTENNLSLDDTPISKASQTKSFGKSIYNVTKQFENAVTNFPACFSDETAHFIQTWVTAKKEFKAASQGKQKKNLHLGLTAISTTQKVMQFDYHLVDKEVSDTSIEANDGVTEQMDAEQRSHTLKTDINVYEARNHSPVMLEADHKVGQQVANRMVEEARLLRGKAKVVSLSEVKDMFDLSSESEKLTAMELSEFINKTGCDITEFLGVEHESSILFVKHPLVLAFLKAHVNHIDESLPALIEDQKSIGEMFSDKVIKTEALRVVLASIIEEFEGVLHRKADEILHENELPVFAPII
ncbi:hypothetical protein AB4393_15440 [Vibrio splendidus]